MSKKMLIDATHSEETRVVVVEGNKVEEFDFESLNKRQLAGNIYLAKVMRIEPSLQAAFVDYGGNRHGFLAFSEIHPDYYQIPAKDREALLAEEASDESSEENGANGNGDEAPKPKRSRSRRSSRSKKSEPKTEAASDGAPSEDDAVVRSEVLEDPSSEAKAIEEDSLQTQPQTEVPVTEASTSSDIDETVAPEALQTEGAESETTPSEEVSSEETSSNEGTRSKSSSSRRRRSKYSSNRRKSKTSEKEAQTDKDEEAPSNDGGISEEDDNIESVGAEDVTEEVAPRRPRPRRYKIQEVIKLRQIVLVQVVKEERGNKGAALTTYLSLAGRYCVLMPNTARGGGISRKITNATDRTKLKQIAAELNVPEGKGLIIRTAGANRTKTEIKRDYEYLIRQWNQIRELTLKSVAPTLTYEEGDLIKRAIRDLYDREIDEILVEGNAGYRQAKDYMKMLMPSHAKKVKEYSDPMPLFARYQVESYLAGMFNPVVQLKSGGYIVIGVTEALVAIDVNSGRATKESSIEDTALKTNLEAAEEVARQLRLRDLAGLIVIDFIDMDERRNNLAVEKRLKDKLRTDRARIQIGRISPFGLLEMSRQRLRPGMIETTTAPCPHCHGTGITRSSENLAISILREVEEEGVKERYQEISLSVPIEIANYILNNKRDHLIQIEQRYSLVVRVEANPHLIIPEYEIERQKKTTRSEKDKTVQPVKTEAEPVIEKEDAKQNEKSSSSQAENHKPSRSGSKSRRGSKSNADRGEKRSEGENNASHSEKERSRSHSDGFALIDSEQDSENETKHDMVSLPEQKEESKPRKRRSRKDTSKSKAVVESSETEVISIPISTLSTVSEPSEESSDVQDVIKESEVISSEQNVGRTDAPQEAEVSIEVPALEEAVLSPNNDEAVVEKADEPPKPKRRGWWLRR